MKHGGVVWAVIVLFSQFSGNSTL